MPKKQTKGTPLFDIRLKNLEHDVLVLKGGETDAASVLLTGKIMLAVTDPLTVRKLSLRMYLTLRLNWTDTPRGASHPKTNRFERRLYEHTWDHMEINKYLSHMYENSGGASNSSIGLNKTLSSASLKNLGSLFRLKSLSNLTALMPGSSSNLLALSSMLSSSASLTTTKSNHVLVQGNYEFPFSAILPGSMPESVEGLPGGSVVYKLEATIDRGKFHNDMVAKKHLRVVRTLGTDAVELSETVAVDNTWPRKVEYSLNVPSKAIAIGSGTPISFMLVPLLKGLRLGDIKIQLVEYYSYMGYGHLFNGERNVVEKVIPRPREEDDSFQLDKWEVDTYVRIPPLLSQCTQDCDVTLHLKVRHKFKFQIGLVNPDGHVSELRASLPVQLFILPFVAISAGPDENDVPEDDHEQLLFHSDLQDGVLSRDEQPDSDPGSGAQSPAFSGMMAPPLYERHIYDRLWGDVSPLDLPQSSGSVTPRNASFRGILEQLSMSPLDTVQLNENLRQLNLQRQLEERLRPVFNFEDENGSHTPEDYFSRGVRVVVGSPDQHFLMSPGARSPPGHLSRVPSDSSLLNSDKLLRVPSYNQAMRQDASEEALSPAYEPPALGRSMSRSDSGRWGDLQSSSSANLALSAPRGGFLGSMNSSNSSSPSHSRDVSSTSLNSMSRDGMAIPGSKSSASPINAALPLNSGIRLNGHKVHEVPQHLMHHTPATQPSSSASDRNAAIGVKGPVKLSSSLSLHNLHFMNKKKGKP